MNGLNQSAINRGLKISIIEGTFATLYTTLAGGMFLAGLALYLGANSFQIALLSAIPALVSGFSFLAGYLVRRVGARKPIVLWTAGLGRTVYLLFVPFLLLGIRFKIELFLLVVMLSSVLMAIAGTVWTSWISDLVPEETRGRFFGLRNAILNVSGVFVAYAAGRGMDWLKAWGQEVSGYALAFTLAVSFGLVSTLLLTRQPEPHLPKRPAPSLKEIFIGPLHEPQFRRLTVFLGVWFLTGTLASPFYLVHLIKNLHFSFAAIAIYSMIGGVIGVLFQLFWGRVIDRFGSRPVTVFNFALVGLMPFLWLFATPKFRLPIWIDAVLNGTVWTGANLGLWNLLLDLADNPVRKESYFAIYSVVTGLGAFIAAIFAGTVAQLLSPFHLTLFTLDFYNYDIMFLLAGIARFASLPLLLKVQEPGSKPVRYTIRVLGNFALWRLNAGKDTVLEALGIKSKD
ncbi:MAG: MFS transporter [candidate division WOR-3 bacterium]